MTSRHLSRRLPQFLNLALCAAVLSLGGCGSATYEEKFKATLDELERETFFKDLLKTPVEFSDVALTLRLPKLFGDRQKTYALDDSELLADPRDKTQPVDPNRIQPDFLKLPGYLRTYERFVEVQAPSGNRSERPLYCYVAAVSRSEKAAGELEAEIKQALLDKFGDVADQEDADQEDADQEEEAEAEDTSAEGPSQPKKGTHPWETVTFPTPDGQTIGWKKITAVGDQNFQYYDDDGAVKLKYLPGVYTLYLHSTDDYHVMLAWRARPDVASSVNMEGLADEVAGSVRIGTPEAS